MHVTELEMPAALTRNVNRLRIALPPHEDLNQDEEYVVVHTDDGWRKVRLHDYEEVFKIPGLYEKWIYQTLKCRSPQRVADLTARCLLKEGAEAKDCIVLDLGAGNGCVAEELRNIGLDHFVGVDLIDEAKMAAERDRPELYADYVVCDITDPSRKQEDRLARHRFNMLICVAALGFGDIPPIAFASAFNRISDGGWIAFNIKSDFFESQDVSPFAMMMRRIIEKGILEVMVQEAYPHRLNPDGEQLEYTAIVGRKHASIPEAWFVD